MRPKTLTHKTVNSRKNKKNCITTQQTTNPQKSRQFTARCSQPLSTNQTPHPTTKVRRQQPNPRRPGATPHQAGQHTSGFPQSGRRGDGLVVSKPNSVSDDFSPPDPAGRHVRCAPNPRHYSSGFLHGIGYGPVPQPFSWCSLERR